MNEHDIHGTRLTARIVPHRGLGTALDLFYQRLGIDPCQYVPHVYAPRTHDQVPVSIRPRDGNRRGGKPSREHRGDE